MGVMVTRATHGGFSARALLRVSAALLLVALAACATRPRLVVHGLTYDGWRDRWHPQATLLEYAYGDSYLMTSQKIERGLLPASAVFGAMPFGEFLYVRWRLKATGETFHVRVDLRNRLPADLLRHELTFVIDGSQLYVFVVTPELIKPHLSSPPLKTWRSAHNVTYEIFPTLRSPDRTDLGEAAPWAPASRDQ
ncbi:hypothetical protein JI739_08965 [Ramlibacter sp. AW1]|uniref:Uncharacterized protein n=1 Tax=Ramlibacter aurantiacus TaxID=2801330 RepID=A0A937D718_9BURK|nr:hypothetical protein [Ramlibacter aurantiacus]MBL0420471.1 hypothetical protein [Ramlibacter aurantiacus]